MKGLFTKQTLATNRKTQFTPCNTAMVLVLTLTALFHQGANAALFGVGEKVNGLPPIVLEAEYDYYGETGKLSKLRNRHLRPPYSLPVSTVAIVDQLNNELERRNIQIPPEVIITDRLRWGRFELFSVLKPVGDGQKISKPTPVICRSKYNCKVDYAFEDRLSTEQRAFLAWTRYYLMKNHSKRRLNNQQSAHVTAEYKLFNISDQLAVSEAAIHFWLNLTNYQTPYRTTQNQAPAEDVPDALQALWALANDLQALQPAELQEQSFDFNQLMETHLQSLFAGQYTYPWTLIESSNAGHTRYERKDLTALELAEQIRRWKSITAHGYITGPDIQYMIVSLNQTPTDIHIIPIQCQSGRCNRLHWEQLRSHETRLLNHPLLLQQFSRYIFGF
ncbi:MAG: hypothetical protein OIF57_19970 [Marinobacterium sp.]|nr:hypothetical protein [Marinobacterium sp.]